MTARILAHLPLENPLNPPQFNSIGLIARVENPRVADSLRTVAKLLAEEDVSILIEHRSAELISDFGESSVDVSEMADCDLVIVVGGDGGAFLVSLANSRNTTCRFLGLIADALVFSPIFLLNRSPIESMLFSLGSFDLKFTS